MSLNRGYLGLYKPFITNPLDQTTIYCISPMDNSFLIVIPLVNQFSKDLIDLVRTHNADTIYLVVSDLSAFMISDIYFAFNQIIYNLGKECRIISATVPENQLSYIFLEKMNVIGEDTPYSILYDEMNVDIIFTRKHTAIAVNPLSHDIIVNTSSGNFLFATEMNADKALYYQDAILDIDNPEHIILDEIHMCFIEGSYSKFSYKEFINSAPNLINIMYVNLFSNYEEYLVALDSSAHIPNKYIP